MTANVRYGHRLGTASREQPDPRTAQLSTKSKHGRDLVPNRVKWVLAGLMLGATAAWMVFRALLTLITLD